MIFVLLGGKREDVWVVFWEREGVVLYLGLFLSRLQGTCGLESRRKAFVVIFLVRVFEVFFCFFYCFKGLRKLSDGVFWDFYCWFYFLLYCVKIRGWCCCRDRDWELDKGIVVFFEFLGFRENVQRERMEQVLRFIRFEVVFRCCCLQSFFVIKDILLLL